MVLTQRREGRQGGNIFGKQGKSCFPKGLPHPWRGEKISPAGVKSFGFRVFPAEGKKSFFFAYFHAKYGDYKATVSILDLCILEGNLPRRATQLVLDWTELNQAELMQNWERCKAKKHPLPIKPLA